MTSLPLPVSPPMSTVRSVAAMRSSTPNTSRMRTERPTTSPNEWRGLTATSSARPSSARNLMRVSPTVMVAPECKQALFDGDVAHARAVERAEIAQEPAFVGLAQLGVEARGVRIVDDHVIGRAGAEANVGHAEDDALLGAGRWHHDEACGRVGRRVARLDRDGRRPGVAGHFAHSSTTFCGFPILGFSETLSGFRRVGGSRTGASARSESAATSDDLRSDSPIRHGPCSTSGQRPKEAMP